jgi:hypothetical protein
MLNLTPIQIALLAMVYEAHEAHPPVAGQLSPADCVAVWGSWQKAAAQLTPTALASLGTERGTRELEYTTLHGRHRRGKEGRLVHLYRLRAHLAAVDLAARCAWAVAHKPKDRLHVTWKDVPAEVPSSAWPDGRRCNACGCVPDKPCTVELPGGFGEGSCVPPGVYGFKWCTACQIKETA